MIAVLQNALPSLICTILPHVLQHLISDCCTTLLCPALLCLNLPMPWLHHNAFFQYFMQAARLTELVTKGTNV